MRHTAPFFITYLTLKTLLHAYDLRVESLALRIEPLGKKSGFKDPITQGIMIVHHTPNLLGQKSIIKLLYFLKTYTPNLLCFTKTLPPNPMNFPIVVASPKLTNQSLNFLDQPFW